MVEMLMWLRFFFFFGGGNASEGRRKGARVIRQSLYVIIQVWNLWKERGDERFNNDSQTAVCFWESFDQADGKSLAKDCTLEECCIRQQWSSSTSPCQSQALAGSTWGKCGLVGSTMVDLQQGSWKCLSPLTPANYREYMIHKTLIFNLKNKLVNSTASLLWFYK